MTSPALLERAAVVLEDCRARRWTIATAESCTGGLIAGLLTEVPGSSAVIGYGFVTYANAAKSRLLGVDESLLAAHGAVSQPVAKAMAEGALAAASADLAVAVTGIAGPGGGSVEKPVGLVHFGLAIRGGETRTEERRFGDLGRAVVRGRAVETALDLLEGALAR